MTWQIWMGCILFTNFSPHFLEYRNTTLATRMNQRRAEKRRQILSGSRQVDQFELWTWMSGISSIHQRNTCGVNSDRKVHKKGRLKMATFNLNHIAMWMMWFAINMFHPLSHCQTHSKSVSPHGFTEEITQENERTTGQEMGHLQEQGSGNPLRIETGLGRRMGCTAKGDIKIYYTNVDNSLMSKYDLILILNSTEDYNVMAGQVPDLATMAVPGYDLFTSDLVTPNTRESCIFMKTHFNQGKADPPASHQCS